MGKHATLRPIVVRRKVPSGGIGAERKAVLNRFCQPFARILARIDSGEWEPGRSHYDDVAAGRVRNERIAGTIPTTPGVPRRAHVHGYHTA